METNNIREYLPVGEPSTDKNWTTLILLNLFGIACWWVFNYGSRNLGTGGWLFFAAMLFLFDISRIRREMDPIKITINTETGDFRYDYATFLGKEKTTTITIKTAYIDYDSTSTGSRLKRLLIYNNYFRNKVKITQNNSSGFTREQLEEVFQKLKETQSNLKS